jgi:hypothetical protein
VDDEMRWIRLRCDRCGPVVLVPDRLLVSILPVGAVVSFSCLCGQRNFEPADETVVRLLREVHVPEQHIELPPREPRHGPPLNCDDLLDFHQALERGDWIRELLT